MRITSALNSSTESTRKDLSSKGVTYSNGRLSVRTDKAAPSREEYIASTRAAFEKGAKNMSLHPEAFKTGPSRTPSGDVPTVGSATGVESPSVIHYHLLQSAER